MHIMKISNLSIGVAFGCTSIKNPDNKSESTRIAKTIRIHDTQRMKVTYLYSFLYLPCKHDKSWLI